MASHRIPRLNTGDVVGECIEKLHEKRRAAREEGMEALVAALEGFVPADDVAHRYFTVLDRCCAFLAKGGAAEAALAYRAIGLLALSVGAGAGAAAATDVDCARDILWKARPLLDKALQAPSAGAAAAATVAALDCLAATTLAGARRSLDAAAAVRAVMGVIRRVGDDDAAAPSAPPEVLAAALSAFALLLTTVGGDDLRTYPGYFKMDTTPFQHLAKLLESDDPSVLMAAGEALAVCAELNFTKHASQEDMDAIEIKVLDLANDASADMTQVNFFQKIADILCQGECPETEEWMPASSSRGVLSASTWARLAQLSFLKRFLRKGFRKHMQDNPLFRQEDTSVATDDDDELPARKGWRRGGGKGKQWTSAMRKDRDIVWESKNSFSQYD